MDGTVYSIDDCMYTTEPVIKHGTRAFVDAMSKSLGGQVRIIHTFSSLVINPHVFGGVYASFVIFDILFGCEKKKNGLVMLYNHG